MERAWRLGEDLFLQDNLFDPITFEEVVMTAKCNCKVLSRDAVIRVVANIMEIRKQDFAFLLDRNIDAILEEVCKQKEGDD